jgi:imidazolonepropionase-like amidohydrolase
MNVGTIQIGQKADILIINGNPLENIEVLKDKENIVVFKDGKLI